MNCDKHINGAPEDSESTQSPINIDNPHPEWIGWSTKSKVYECFNVTDAKNLFYNKYVILFILIMIILGFIVYKKFY